MQENNLSLKTPLFSEHEKHSAHFVPFGDWMMPIRYGSVIEEHHWVRNECGLFDVSHMGEIRVSGKDAEAYLQKLCTNHIGRLKEGGGLYTALCNENGGFVDDLIVYKLRDKDYLVCVNASNEKKDFAWFQKNQNSFEVKVENQSKQWAQIAVQGPKSLRALEEYFEGSKDLTKIQPLEYTCITEVQDTACKMWVARTGYTGEWGYELYVPKDFASAVWSKLCNLKHTKCLPIGLGARDSLRLEAGYLLYGNDMDDTVNPLEAGIAWAVKLDKGDFIGRQAIVDAKEKSTARMMIAFQLVDPGIPRHGMEIFNLDGEKIGVVTSGGVLPSVGGSGGLALVKSKTLDIGQDFYVDIRGKRKLARVFKRPLYSARVKG